MSIPFTFFLQGICQTSGLLSGLNRRGRHYSPDQLLTIGHYQCMLCFLTVFHFSSGHNDTPEHNTIAHNPQWSLKKQNPPKGGF
ncbi:hypothetical protein [Morganella psychrotolerans]|uniref:hypothetical protein n=1 Tax=Morganella psychrotolerans TaxID=368603 RepID=UPI0012E8D259|nr:hypothetical protein [Morganella psychrotolerans]